MAADKMNQRKREEEIAAEKVQDAMMAELQRKQYEEALAAYKAEQAAKGNSGQT